jgi:DNA polymerase elongation subunit (family B)
VKTLIFDIETVGEKFQDMDTETQEALTSWIQETSQSQEQYQLELDRLKNRMGFSPLHGEIVSLATLDGGEENGGVYFQAPDAEIDEFSRDGVRFKPMDEAGILEKFWEIVTNYQAVAGFNSRGFDGPFLNIRSAVHGIRPSTDIMQGRYLYQQKYSIKHIDLYDQFTYYGSMRTKGNLHLWTRAFSIGSPKSGDIHGSEVGEYFQAGKYTDIADYNLGDVYATRDLYRIWRDYLDFQT